MTQIGKYHGGIVFVGYHDTLIDRLSRVVAATFEDYGHPVERQSVTDAQNARITASFYHIRLTLAEAVPASDQMQRSMRLDRASRLNIGGSAKPTPWRLQIDLLPVDPARDVRDISELLLVVMLYRLIEDCEALAIEWLDPATVLTLEQFLDAFANLPSGRIRDRPRPIEISDPRFAAIPGTATRRPPRDAAPDPLRPAGPAPGPARLPEDRSLALAYRAEPDPKLLRAEAAQALPQSDVQRLAIWCMTGMLAFLSGPVAVSMAAVNLIRGEDLRLNTHVLSLTGLLVVLQSSGMLASAVALLPL